MLGRSRRGGVTRVSVRNISSNSLIRGFALRALAVGRFQITFAQAHGGWRHLDELVVIDEFHGLFQRKSNRRGENENLLFSSPPPICPLLFPPRRFHPNA